VPSILPSKDSNLSGTVPVKENGGDLVMRTRKRQHRDFDTRLSQYSDDDIKKLIPKNEYKNKGVCINSDGFVMYKHVKSDDPNWAIIDPLLGRVKDSQIAKFFGIPQLTIYNRRERLKILPYDHIDWTIVDPLLSKGCDEEISELFDKEISIEAIRKRRKDLGIYFVD
jgi:hypothetical protein